MSEDKLSLIERLRAIGEDETAEELLQLRAKVLCLEAEVATILGRMKTAAEAPEPPFAVREEPPNTPR